MRLRERLLDLFFAPRCGVCGEILASGEVFCPACRALLLRAHTSFDPRGRRFAFSDCVFAAPYDDRTRGAILRLKRIPESAEAEVFAQMMAQALCERYPGETFSAAVAVPMAPEKLRRRGFNQSEELARLLCAHFGIPLAEGLLIQRDTGAAQHTLSEVRRFENAAASYDAAPNASIGGRVLLIDDILTSGATLGRCASLLREAGAGEVIALAATCASMRADRPPQEERS